MNRFRTARFFLSTALMAAVMSIASVGTAVAQEPVLPETLPGGFTLVRPVDYYNAENLFELINGQAIFYLSYGFTKLHHAYYEKDGQTYKTDLYMVADNLSALGCYREQMDEGADALGTGTEGYLLEYLAACYKGPYYLEVVPEADGRPSDMQALATAVMALINHPAALPTELALFPQENLIAGSESYFGESLLSYSFLGNGLSVEYTQTGDRPLRVFIAMPGDTGKATAMVAEFAGKLSETEIVTLQDALTGVKGELPYRGESCAFNFENYVIGCIGAADSDSAFSILGKLLVNIATAEAH